MNDLEDLSDDAGCDHFFTFLDNAHCHKCGLVVEPDPRLEALGLTIRQVRQMANAR